MARPIKKHDPAIASEILRLRGQGVSVKDICSLVEISERSARRIYKSELERGKSQANAAIAGKLYELCMNGNVTALIFWAKTRMGWSEKPKEAGTDIETLKKGIASAFDSVGNGGQKCGVLVTPGILTEKQWLEAAHGESLQQ